VHLNVVLNDHRLVFQVVHQEHEWRFRRLYCAQLAENFLLVIESGVDGRHYFVSSGVDSAMAAEWETAHKAVQPRNRPANADFLESNNMTLRVFVVNVLVYLFLPFVFSLHFVQLAHRV